MTLSAALILSAATGLALFLATPAVLRRLPEPSTDPGADDADGADPGDAKIPYAALATRRFVAIVGVLSAVAVAIPALSLPRPVLPGWLVLATLGVLLAAIDARTTWLPLPLTRVAWVAMAAATGVGAVLGGWAQLVRGLGGFLVAGAVFGAIWLITRGGIGFGDVRFAPLVGAATAAASWTLLAWALVLGSLAGALVGLIRLAVGRRGAVRVRSVDPGRRLPGRRRHLADDVEQGATVRVRGRRLRGRVMSAIGSAQSHDVPVRTGVHRQEVLAQPLTQLILPRQPDDIAELHRVERPLHRAVEVEPGVAVAGDQLDHHVAHQEHGVGDLRTRDEELVTVVRLPVQVRRQLTGKLTRDHAPSLIRAPYAGFRPRPAGGLPTAN